MADRYSLFKYQYRDASNYKELEMVALRGVATDADRAVIEGKLDGDGLSLILSVCPPSNRACQVSLQETIMFGTSSSHCVQPRRRRSLEFLLGVPSPR